MNSTGRRGRRRRTGREREERGSGGVKQREQWEDPLEAQPDRENDLSQTCRGVGGMCVGVVPRVQSNFSRALHEHRGKKLLQDLQNLENTAKKRAMVTFGGAREKSTMTFVECLSVSQGETIEGPLCRET